MMSSNDASTSKAGADVPYIIDTINLISSESEEPDSADEIPSSSKKLERRPVTHNPEISVPQEKYRELPRLTSKDNLSQELEIEKDVKATKGSLDSEGSTSEPDRDPIDEIPSSSKKLKTRPVTSVPQEKRLSLPQLTSNYDLSQESEIEEDDKTTNGSLDSEWSTSESEDDVMIEEPPPVYEVVYQERSEALSKEFKELHSYKHHKYVEDINKQKLVLNDKLIKSKMKRDLRCEAVEREYEKNCQQIKEETEKLGQQILEKLIAELNEKKKTIIAENQLEVLETDSVNQIPSSSRKLRRKPSNPGLSVQLEKRRKIPQFTSSYFMLKELEIDEDIIAIKKLLASGGSTSKPDIQPSSSTDMNSPKINDSETFYPNIRIESGKLYYDKRWYHRGQPIFVEETPMEKFPAIITYIGREIIWVKKTLDNTKFRINFICLLNSKISITRRAL